MDISVQTVDLPTARHEVQTSRREHCTGQARIVELAQHAPESESDIFHPSDIATATTRSTKDAIGRK